MSNEIRAAFAAKAERKASLLRALTGAPEPPPRPRPASPRVGGFDGGARKTPPSRQPTEAEFFAAMIEDARERRR